MGVLKECHSKWEEACKRWDTMKTGLVNFEQFQEVMDSCSPATSREGLLEAMISSGSVLVRYHTFLDWCCSPGVDALPATKGSDEMGTLRARVAELEASDSVLKAQIAELEAQAESNAKSNGAGAGKPSGLAPNHISAEGLYNNAFEQVGGDEAIKTLRLESMQIKKLTTKRPGLQPWEQDPVYLGLEPSVLLRDAEIVHDKFADACQLFIDMFTESGLTATPLIAPRKGIVRSLTKINVKYSGNVCQLSDITRGTLKVAACGKDTLTKVYKAMLKMVSSPPEGVQFLHFDDRFLRAMPGGYRDFLFLVSIRGILCELQINLDIILKVKEGEGHEEYEVVRLMNDLMLDAAQKNDQSSVKQHLKKGANANYRTSQGFTPLSYAAMHGNRAMATALLEANADPFKVDCTGCLSVTRALNMGKLDAAKVIVTEMANCCANRSNDIALNGPSRKDIVKTWHTLRMMNKADKNVDELCTLFNQVFDRASGGIDGALVIAAGNGLAAVCGSLLEAKATPNALSWRSDVGDLKAPMDFAIESGSTSVVKLLALHGGCANLYAIDSFRVRFRRKALQQDQADQVDALIEASMEQSWNVNLIELLNEAEEHRAAGIACVALRRGAGLKKRGQRDQVAALAHCAACNNNLELVALLSWRKGNFSDCYGAVVKAADRGLTTMIELLAEAGSPLEANDEEEEYHPLHMATCAGHEGMVKTLINLKCDIATLGGSHRDGFTAAHLAAEMGHTKLLQLFSQHCDLTKLRSSKKGKKGWYLLHSATGGNQSECTKVLLELRCEIECVNKNRNTPLLQAVTGGRSVVAQVLIKAGADVNAKYGNQRDQYKAWQNGSTALHVAAGTDQLDILKLLIDFKADSAAKDSYGRTAIDLAEIDASRELLRQAGVISTGAKGPTHKELIAKRDKDRKEEEERRKAAEAAGLEEEEEEE